ncbi:hypothetical protein J8273_3792 [Carpediemonas membranifera]|uniref:Uncharacterized protein n=1 Tax=Carpediemonas membranifera TaxID=201153 RepID=A0A8J6ATY6_9EUKA|nr:hypothetical protein J8273_3792 [Carpediemonas membranifera]|eukprot:KAG9394546.1 hypothetical protein J8273_3792 [Carpediemonas membranifera]
MTGNDPVDADLLDNKTQKPSAMLLLPNLCIQQKIALEVLLKKEPKSNTKLTVNYRKNRHDGIQVERSSKLGLICQPVLVGTSRLVLIALTVERELMEEHKRCKGCCMMKCDCGIGDVIR